MDFKINTELRDFASMFLRLDQLESDQRIHFEKLKEPFKDWVNNRITNPNNPLEAYILYCANIDDYSQKERIIIGERIVEDLRNYKV